MKLVVKATSWALKKKKKKDITAPRLPTGSLDAGQIKVLGFLIPPFLTGKIRKLSLLAVGRKRTAMLCLSVLGGGKHVWGDYVFLLSQTEQNAVSQGDLCASAWPCMAKVLNH